MNITGAELFVKALRAEHVDTLFAYPGGQVIDLFNALYDEVAIGTRFNDHITGAPGTFASHAAIIHIDIDPASVAGNVAADIPLVADAKKALRTLLDKAIPLHIQE